MWLPGGDRKEIGGCTGWVGLVEQWQEKQFVRRWESVENVRRKKRDVVWVEILGAR